MGTGIETGAMAGTAAIGTLTKVLAPLLAAISAIKAAETALTFNNMRQQSELAFETMLGSAERAKAMVQDIITFAANTPFEVKGLTESTQKLLAFGFQAKDVLPMLQTIGDAMAGLSMGAEGIDRAVRALGQMAARGKVTSQEMMQLTELGIPAWQALAEAIGTDTGTAMGMVEKGAVSAATGINAVLDLMDTKFAGLMEKQSHTLGGLASTIKDTFAQTIGGIAEPAVNRLTAAMQRVVDFASTPAFTAWVESAKSNLEDLMTALGPFVEFFTTRLPATLEGWKGVLDAVLSGNADAIESAFSNLAQVAAENFSKLGELVGPRLESLFEGISDWVQQNGPALADRFTSTWAPAAAQWLTEAAVAIVARLPQILYDIGQWIATTGAPKVIEFGANLAKGIAVGFFEGLKNSIPTVGEALSQWWEDVTAHAQGRRTSGEREQQQRWAYMDALAAGRVAPPPPPPEIPGPPEAPPAPNAPTATTRLQRGFIETPTDFAPKVEEEKKKAETAIMGFMEALAAARADMKAQFGQLGAEGASALANAITANTAAAGGSVARAMESLLIQAQEAGIENWRQLGDELASAFHDALILRTEEAQQQALTMLTRVTAEVAGARAATAINEATDKAEQAIIEAQGKAQEQADRLAEAFDASEALRQTMDRMNEELRQGLERMQATQQRVTDQITAGRSARDLTRQYGREDFLTGESRQLAQSDMERNASRRMADLQRQYAQRVADIQRRGGPGAQGQLSDAARQLQEQMAEQFRQTAQQKADMQERFALEDQNRQRQRQWAAEDAAQRMADVAADKERAKANQAALETERARLQAPIDRLQLEQREKSLAQQIAGIRKNEYESVLRMNEALAETIRLEGQRASRSTGGAVGGESSAANGDAGETVEITDVNMDGERVGTLSARHTYNHVATRATVMGGA